MKYLIIMNFIDVLIYLNPDAVMQPTYCPLYLKLIILMKDKNMDMLN